MRRGKWLSAQSSPEQGIADGQWGCGDRNHGDVGEQHRVPLGHRAHDLTLCVCVGGGGGGGAIKGLGTGTWMDCSNIQYSCAQ